MNIESLRLSDSTPLTLVRSKEPTPKAPQRAPFLKGPVPISWLQKASSLPGKCLAVGTVLWFRAGLERSGSVSLNLSRLNEWGLTKDSARRALNALEGAGLVRVLRRPGRKPLVTILTANGTSSVPGAPKNHDQINPLDGGSCHAP